MKPIYSMKLTQLDIVHRIRRKKDHDADLASQII